MGMNYGCEITYPVGESITDSIMSSFPQALAIGLTFLCDYYITEYKDKKWISNIILLIMLVISIIFVFLLDEKLDRQEVEQAGRLNDKNNILENKNNNNIIIDVINNK